MALQCRLNQSETAPCEAGPRLVALLRLRVTATVKITCGIWRGIPRIPPIVAFPNGNAGVLD